MKCNNCGAYVAPQDSNCLSCGALLEDGQTVGAQAQPAQAAPPPPPTAWSAPPTGSPYGVIQPPPPFPDEPPAPPTGGTYPPPQAPQAGEYPPPVAPPPPVNNYYGAPPPQPPYPPDYYPSQVQPKGTALVLGIVGVIFAVLFPLVTYCTSIVGLVMAINARKTGFYRPAALPLNIVALGVALLNSIGGCLLNASIYSWLY